MKTFNFLIILAATCALSAAETRTNTPNKSCCSTAQSASRSSDKSIYQAESTWITDHQKQLKLSALGGRPQVLVMFFANCQFACPVLVNDMKKIEAALAPEVRSRVGFTLVSFDCKRDTPAALAQYRRARDLPEKNWTLLCGKPDDVLELAALLGLNFKEDANGQFSHSNVITILNAQGEIAHQQTGLSGDSRETIRLLQELAAK